MTTSRRLTLIMTAVALSVAACGQATDAPERQRLVVSTFGFAADRVEETVVKPFERQTGIDVVLETGANAERLNKLRVNRNAPTADVVLMSDFYAAIGEKEGLFEKVDATAVPNLANIYPFARNPDGYGPAYTYALLGMIYRTDLVKGRPTIAELGAAGYKGQVAVPDTAITAGIPFLLALAEKYGTGPRDVEAAFRALNRLKPNVLTFFGRSTELISLLDRSEAVMAPGLDSFVVDLVKTGKPVAWIPLDAGRYVVTNRVEIVKGTRNKAAAQRFVDHLLARDVQERSAVSFNDKPVNTAAKVPDTLVDVAGKAAADPAVDGFHPVDLDFVVANYDAWIDRFTREVSQ